MEYYKNCLFSNLKSFVVAFEKNQSDAQINTLYVNDKDSKECKECKKNKESKENETITEIKNKKKLYFDHLLQGKIIREYYDDSMTDSRKKALDGKCYTCTQIEEPFSSVIGSGRRVTMCVNRHGDYCEMPILILKMEKVSNRVKIGELIKTVTLKIGGYDIDKLYDVNLDILLKLYKLKHEIIELDDNTICHFIPLPFDIFIGKNILPLILLNYYEVRIDIFFNEFQYKLHEGSIRFDYISINSELSHTSINNENCAVIKYMNDIKIPHTIGILQTGYCGRERVDLKYLIDNTINFKCGFEGETLMTYFVFTNHNNEIITHNLINEVEVSLGNKTAARYKEYEMLYNSKKLIDIPGVYCVPFIPMNEIHHIQDNVRGSINFSHFDSTFRIKLNDKIKQCSDEYNNINIHYFTLRKNILHFYDGCAKLVHCN